MCINLKVNSDCQSGNNAFINCGHCITDCCYSLGYTVLTSVTTLCSLTCNYQLLNETSAQTMEAAYLLLFASHELQRPFYMHVTEHCSRAVGTNSFLHVFVYSIH